MHIEGRLVFCQLPTDRESNQKYAETSEANQKENLGLNKQNNILLRITNIEFKLISIGFLKFSHDDKSVNLHN